MGWKDFFYFQKQDRVAIVVLLLLIAIGGALYVYTLPANTDKNVAKEELNDKEMETFSSEIEHTAAKSKNNLSQNSGTYIHYEKLAQGETVDLNSADTTALKKIPSIGSSFANRIVKYRNLLGGFAHVEQLKEVWGLDDERYNKVKPYVLIQTKPKKLKVNKLPVEDLQKHPYINYKQAKVIVDIRQRKGYIESVDRLSLLQEFTDKDIRRLTAYLSFE